MGHYVNEKALRCQEYITREENIRHHTYREERTQFELLRAGDPRALDARRKASRENQPGRVSLDPLRNLKYLTVTNIASSCRAAIEGGVDEKRAYDISDLYIQKMDLMDDPAEIKCLGDDAFAFYLREVQSVAKKRVVSRHVSLCLDYIYNHLHEPIPVRELADLTGLSPIYLSALFKSEMGQPISEYIMAKKMEAAQNMLRYTDYSSAEISSTLNFSSQSHFIRAFKRHTGETPKRYREQNRSSSTPGENACG